MWYIDDILFFISQTIHRYVEYQFTSWVDVNIINYISSGSSFEDIWASGCGKALSKQQTCLPYNFFMNMILHSNAMYKFGHDNI